MPPQKMWRFFLSYPTPFGCLFKGFFECVPVGGVAVVDAFETEETYAVCPSIADISQKFGNSVRWHVPYKKTGA